MIYLSQDRRPQQGPISRSPKEQVVPKKRKIFTKSNFTKIFLPLLFLVGVILTPVLFEAFNTRHQRIDDIIYAPYNGGFDPFDDPDGGLDITPDDPDGSDDFMDDFTNGLTYSKIMKEMGMPLDPSKSLWEQITGKPLLPKILDDIYKKHKPT